MRRLLLPVPANDAEDRNEINPLSSTSTTWRQPAVRFTGGGGLFIPCSSPFGTSAASLVAKAVSAYASLVRLRGGDGRHRKLLRDVIRAAPALKRYDGPLNDEIFPIGRRLENGVKIKVITINPAAASLKRVCVLRSVTILGQGSFCSVEAVTFESESRVRRFGDGCFVECRLKSIWIPRSVESFGFGCFTGCAQGQLEVVLFDSNSDLRELGVMCFAFSAIKSIDIPLSVEILGDACFFRCARLERVEFERQSRLRRVPRFCFQGSPLKSICIPASVQCIGLNGFSGVSDTILSGLQVLSVEPGAQLTTIETWAFCATSLRSICIPRSVEIIGEHCFLLSKRLEALAFEPGSRLREIPQGCFVQCGLRTIDIPRTIRVLKAMCFSQCANICRITFESASELTQMEESCFFQSSLRSICIPRSVKVLGPGCFGRATVGDLVFEEGSNLRRFENECFVRCSLRSLVIPKRLAFIGPKAFSGLSISLMAVDPGNQNYFMFDECLVESCTGRLIRYFGTKDELIVSKHIRIIGESSVSDCVELKSVKFARNGHVMRTEARAFSVCSLKLIIIPRSIQVLGSLTFRFSTSEYFVFESHSRLRLIEESCFLLFSVKSLCIPRSVEVLGKLCFWDARIKKLTFESHSRLTLIEEKCLEDTPSDHFCFLVQFHVWAHDVSSVRKQKY
jgi:hypothetical protein